MSQFEAEIDAALQTDGVIPREKVIEWIGSARDLTTLSKLYRLTDKAYYRIQPELDAETTRGLIQRYLLGCIREGRIDDAKVLGSWEAAQTLHVWFCHLRELGGRSSIIAAAADAVKDAFLSSDEEVQLVIEQGFLEHALESPKLRPYFQDWSNDPRLEPAWSRALEWGEAHQISCAACCRSYAS